MDGSAVDFPFGGNDEAGELVLKVRINISVDSRVVLNKLNNEVRVEWVDNYMTLDNYRKEMNGR